MNVLSPIRTHAGLSVLLLVFVVAAGYLFAYSLPSRPFDESRFIYDIIRLDSWCVFFLVVAIAIWLSNLTKRIKAWLLLGSFSIFGAVAISVMFAGSTLGYNACWGDKSFDMAMVLKFMTFAVPGDFYYKHLPPFYPPVYFLLLSLYGRLFSIEGIKMLKVGGVLIYAFGPALLYWMWRSLLSPLQAAVVTLSTYLFATVQFAFPLSVPHAFLADTLFVPWWLVYVEQVRKLKADWRYYIGGGLIGALIFCTYFYPFFIGALLLLLRSTLLSRWEFLKKGSHFRVWPAVGLLGCVAAFSIPYWLPLFVSIAEFGIDRSRGGFNHLGATAVQLRFLEFGVVGLIYLGGIIYSARRSGSLLHRGLLQILGATVIFLAVGSALESVGADVNLAKVRQFVAEIGGIYVGLALAGLLQLANRRERLGRVVKLVAAALLLGSLTAVAILGKSAEVKNGRTTAIPTFGTNADRMRDRAGAITLSAYNELYSFNPMYTFISINEHYSHPASRYIERYDLLNSLQLIGDPYVYWLALRHNVYDCIDFFLPQRDKGDLCLLANISNFPNGSLLKTLRYSQDLVDDTAYFPRTESPSLYRVAEAAAPAAAGSYYPHGGIRDSLMYLARIRVVRDCLDAEGVGLLDAHLNVDWSKWIEVPKANVENGFGDEFRFLGLFSVSTNDSTFLLCALEPAKDVAREYRVFVHAYAGTSEQFTNYDFSPYVPTNRWKKWDISWCVQSLPPDRGFTKCHFGLFEKGFRPGDGVWIDVVPKSASN